MISIAILLSELPDAHIDLRPSVATPDIACKEHWNVQVMQRQKWQNIAWLPVRILLEGQGLVDLTTALEERESRLAQRVVQVDCQPVGLTS